MLRQARSGNAWIASLRLMPAEYRQCARVKGSAGTGQVTRSSRRGRRLGGRRIEATAPHGIGMVWSDCAIIIRSRARPGVCPRETLRVAGWHDAMLSTQPGGSLPARSLISGATGATGTTGAEKGLRTSGPSADRRDVPTAGRATDRRHDDEEVLDALGPMNGATLSDDVIDRERTRYRGAVYVPVINAQRVGSHRGTWGVATHQACCEIATDVVSVLRRHPV